MAEIGFSYNWNNKLGCNSFTTIRLHQPNKYQLNQVYQIKLKGEYLFDAQIIAIKPFMYNNLNEFIAHLDTGYSAEECKNIILKMYPNVNFETTTISLILLHKIK